MQLCWLGKFMVHGKITKEYSAVSRKIEPLYSVVSALLFMVFPNVYTAVIYTKILLKLRGLRKSFLRPKSPRKTILGKDDKALLSFLLMGVCLFFLSGPYFVLRLLIDTKLTIMNNLNDVKYLCIIYFLTISTSIINPILYAICKTE